MHSTAPSTPPWIETLPHDSRGFPVPAEAPWLDGSPSLKAGDVARTVLLATKGACAVCGRAFAPGQVVYRAFAEVDAEEIRQDEHELATEANGPAHLSCILYSTYACPYLSKPTARLGKGTMYPNTGRGDHAAVLGFRTWGVLELEHQAPLIAFLDLVEDHAYTAPEDLVDLYEAAVAADAETLNSAPLNYWGADYGPKMVMTFARDALEQFRRRRKGRDVTVKMGSGRLFEA